MGRMRNKPPGAHALHLPVIIALYAVLILLHYPETMIPLEGLRAPYLFGFNRHSIERILFLLPLTYSFTVFGRQGSRIALSAAAVAMIPRILFVTAFPLDALFESAGTLGVAVLVMRLLESRKRELARREQLKEMMRCYAERTSAAQEEERKRISRDLHDDTIQTLVALSRRIDNLVALSGDRPETLPETLGIIRNDIDESVLRIREYIQTLRSPTLEYLGLLPALRELTEQAAARNDLDIGLSSEGTLPRLDPGREVLIFRIIQEAVQNVIRHADASHVEIHIRSGDGVLGFRIADDGKGFIPLDDYDNLRADKMGILGMSERTRLLGGSFRIESAPGRGTGVCVDAVPLL